jgi:DNA-binding NtrC family response regulator/tetratricopeptide (TPR) repeat protein
MGHMGRSPLRIDSILGNSRNIKDLRAQIERLTVFDTPGNPRVPTVLLEGETGTGKGLPAQVIHAIGPRAAGPFVDVNCAAIPEPMLEAELFGFEAGAFTDAKRAKPGLFESASGGTLFLDEIDSLSAPVQGKVLKAIEEKSVRRLGSVSSAAFDVKLIAATQKDLRIEAARGAFRADLFHRLAVLVLKLPSLREREDDAILLGERFLHEFAAAHGVEPKELTPGACDWLRQHPWPGNVRELGHLMERVTLLCPQREIGADALRGLAIESPVAAPEPATTARDLGPAADAADDEAERIRAAIARTGGNVVRAARMLGLGRNALRYRMRRLGIGRDESDAGVGGGAAQTAAQQRAKERTPLAASPRGATEPAWEPKSVAVLAIALGFPEASGGTLDYEPWTAARRWERAIVERIEGFGGVLLQHSPSRLTAVFGVPRALEQASLRAVQAVLAVRRAVEQSGATRPEVRSAVHIGEVRVDVHATDPIASVLPIGDVFSLPERLLGHAGPGELLVSPSVARRIERFCEMEERGAQLGPRETDLLWVHRVEGPRRRAGAESSADPGATPIVGRHRELSVLHDAFARAAQGHGQIVFVAGDAGIGKSRLLGEFRKGLAGRAHRWVEGHCASYGTRTPFLPVIDGLHRYLSIDDADDEVGATAKIAHEVERLGADLYWTLPLVQQVLSLRVGDDAVRGLDSASRRSEIFRALRALTLRAAELEPLVLVIEDLHWIDPASEEYLSFVGEAIPAARALVVLSHRPGYTHSFGDRSYHQRVTLAPLSRDDTARMTGSILGTTNVPAELQSLIAEKAEGNPFFVEELTRSLLEDGSLRHENGRVVLARALEEISVPDTIQDVLVARIDRLADESKRAIQIASVIGREFALRLLERITDAGDRIHSQVEELRALELVYEKALHPELAYMFKHALTHDVAYESVLRERRKSLHRTIGRAIEELYRDRLAEHYETLAHHFSRAEEWGRALHYYEKSADKADETYANRAVIEHCRQALEIADQPGADATRETRRRLYERLGRARFYLSQFEESGVAFEQVAAHCSDADGESFFLAEAALSHFWAHRYEAGERCVERALDVAREDHAHGGEAKAIGVEGFRRGVLEGDVGAFEGALRRGLEICSRHPHEEAEAFALHELSFVLEWTGDYAGAVDHAERALVIGRRLRRADLIILPTWFLGKARCCIGDYGGAVTLLEEAHQLCARIGDRAWRSRLLNTLGWCFAEIGWPERARDYNERAAALAREIGDPEILSNASVNLAMNHIALGEPGRSLEQLEPIEAALSRPGDPWMRWRYALHVRQARAFIELAQGEPEKARAAAAAELEGARRHRAPKIEARALATQGHALLAMDEREEAARAFDTALRIAERIGYRRGVWQAYRALAECARRSGEGTRAEELMAAARQIAAAAARTLADDDLRRRVVASVDSASG